MSLQNYLAIAQNSQRTITVLTYQLGDMAKCSIYRESFPSSHWAYTSELRLAMADAITMIRLLCEQEGFDFLELQSDGTERFIERQAEVRKSIEGAG
jgi:hypothetical protein